MKRAVVTIDCGVESKVLERWKQTMSGNTDNVDVIVYKPDIIENLEDTPISYASFKVMAINQALRDGFDSVLYLQPNLFSVKNILPVFQELESNGYLLQQTQHSLGEWTNDRTLNYFGLSRDRALEIGLYSSQIMGVCRHSEIAMKFLEMLSFADQKGAFIGNITNSLKTESLDERCLGHAQDLSAGAIIATNLEMKLKNHSLIEQLYPEASPSEKAYFQYE